MDLLWSILLFSKILSFEVRGYAPYKHVCLIIKTHRVRIHAPLKASIFLNMLNHRKDEVRGDLRRTFQKLVETETCIHIGSIGDGT